MNKVFYTLIWFFLTAKTFAATNDPLGLSRLEDSNLKHGDADLVTSADNILWYLVGLLYFISVVIWIYWGFLILTSGWDDEKVKKWKNYLIYMVIWLVVIFLASIIVRWIIDVMTQTT
jgi:hypothetical protein